MAKRAKSCKKLKQSVARVGDRTKFYDVKTGRKVSLPIHYIKRYSLAKGRNSRRMKGYYSHIAFHEKRNGQRLPRSLGICKGNKRSTRKRSTRKRSSRKRSTRKRSSRKRSSRKRSSRKRSTRKRSSRKRSSRRKRYSRH